LNFPPPLPGLLIRYSFLWSTEAAEGATEGRKDRPCAIVVAVPGYQHGDTRVVVVPVTHVPQVDLQVAIELPSEVKAELGLDAEKSWVRLDELNVFSWPGYDLRPIGETGRIEYGPLPHPLFERIRRGVLDLHRAKKTRHISRD
jgi:uncharacterized protein YifN (PemK superfamily)